MKFLFLTVFFILLQGVCWCQNSFDFAKEQLKLKNYDSAISIYQSIIDSSQLRYEKAKAYFTIGFCYQRKNDPVNAINPYFKALDLYEEKGYKASCYTNLGNIYFRAGLYNESIELYNQSIELEDVPKILSKTLLNRAYAYRKLSEYDNATIDALQAKKIADSLQNKSLLFRALNEQGLIKKDERKYNEAISLFNEANGLGIKRKTYANLGIVHELMGNFSLAEREYKRALKESSVSARFHSSKNLGNLYLSTNQLELAFVHLKMGMSLLSQVNNPESEELKIYQLMATYYKNSNQKEEAIATLEESVDILFKFNEVQKELTQKFQQTAILKATKEYELNAEKTEIEDNKRTTNYSIIILSLISILGLFLIIRKMKANQKEKFLYAQELKSSINSVSKKLS